MNYKATVLIVDDEILNLEILSEHLHAANYQTVRAEDGQQALDLLSEDKNRFHAVLLDRMMPDIDGIEVLLKIKQDPQLAMLPVILQSAKAIKKDISDGLEAGASYYLTKPFDGSLLLAIVETAIDGYKKFLEMKANITDMPEWQDHEEFNFRTPAEAQNLARLVAVHCENGEVIAIGLLKLMTEAIEQGNLEIDFDQKAKLMVTGRLCEEILRRLKDPVFGDRNARLVFDRSPTEYHFQVVNEGKSQAQSIVFDNQEDSGTGH
jgi:CheY-like chemotaxis protein